MSAEREREQAVGGRQLLITRVQPEMHFNTPGVNRFHPVGHRGRVDGQHRDQRGDKQWAIAA
jgi:hypothetical protein